MQNLLAHGSKLALDNFVIANKQILGTIGFRKYFLFSFLIFNDKILFRFTLLFFLFKKYKKRRK